MGRRELLLKNNLNVITLCCLMSKYLSFSRIYRDFRVKTDYVENRIQNQVIFVFWF